MAIDIYPKHWQTIPPIGAKAITGHPLCPKFGWVWNNGLGVDLVNNIIVVPTGTPGSVLYSATSARGHAGIGREHSATTDVDNMGLDTLLLPTSGGCTIVIMHQKTDGTLRNCVTFGDMGAATANCCDAYLPFQDGVAYWDYGGQTNGTNRVQVGSLTFGDDIWVLTVGPREMAIYQNGIPRVSNTTINPTRTNATAQWALGNRGAGPAVSSDLVKYKAVFIYHRQLSVAEILMVSNRPFCWVDPRP